MAITAATLRLTQGLKRQLEGIVDAQVRDLTAAWVRGFDEVATDLSDALLELATVAGAGGRISRAMMLRSSRLQQALVVMGEQLTDLAQQAGVRIGDDVATIVAAAGHAQADIVASQLPPGILNVTTGRVDPEQIKAIVTRSTQQITSDTKPIGRDAMIVVRRELVRGTAVGANPRETAARIVARAGDGFDGGLTRALVIARTESLDAQRQASAAAQAEHADVLAGWVWSATLDVRTCPACWGMAGSVHPLTEPGPLGHQQCRCARVPQSKSWRDLGIDIEEPPSLLPDAQTQFEALSPAEQRKILGPARYEAWKAGRFPMDQWAQRRKNPGWRDGYYVAPAPSGAGASRVA